MRLLQKWKRWGIAAIAMMAMVPAVSAEGQPPELLEPVGVDMDTAAAYIGEISSISIHEASVAPAIEEMFFQVDGVAEVVHVVIGQQVLKGDVLIELEQEALNEQMETLEAQIEQMTIMGEFEDELAGIDLSILAAELRALEKQNPVDADAIALKQLDIEELKLNMAYAAKKRGMQLARMEEELARLRLQEQDRTLRAPFDGTVLHIADLMGGSRVRAFAPVLYLADESRLMIDTDYLSESMLDSCHDCYALVGGGRYEIESVPVDAEDYASALLAGETVRSQFEIKNMDEKIEVGMYAVVCLERGYVDDALLIPSNALHMDGSGSYVYVIEDGERVRKNVTKGQSNDWLTQIKEGLSEGEIVYVKD